MLPDPATQPTLKVNQAAALLGVDRNTLYEAIKRGEVPSIRIGRSIRVPTAGLLRMLEAAA